MNIFTNTNRRKIAYASMLMLWGASPVFSQTDFAGLSAENKPGDPNIEFRYDLETATTTINFITQDGRQLTVFKDYSDETSTTKSYFTDGVDTLFDVYQDEGETHIISESILNQRSNGDVVLEYSEKQSLILEEYRNAILSFGQNINDNRGPFVDTLSLALNSGVATRTEDISCGLAFQANLLANVAEEVNCFPNPATPQCGIAIGASTIAFQAMLGACNIDFFGDDGDGGDNTGGSNGGSGSGGGNPTIIVIQGGGSGSGAGGGSGPLHCEVFGGIIHCVTYRD